MTANTPKPAPTKARRRNACHLGVRHAVAACLLSLAVAFPAVTAEPPVADAGEDQVVGEGVVVTLDGTGSTAEGSAVYVWRAHEDNEREVRFNEDAATIARTGIATFEAPKGLQRDVQFTFVLTVTDVRGIFISDVVTITTRAVDFGAVADNTLMRVGHSIALNALDAIGGRFIESSGLDAPTYESNGYAMSMDAPGGAHCMNDTVRHRTGLALDAGAASNADQVPGWMWSRHTTANAHYRARASSSAMTPPATAFELGMPRVRVPKIRLPKIGGKKRTEPRECRDQPRWTFWGRGDLRGFDDQPDAALTMEGNVLSYYLGIDYRWSARSVAGVALSMSEGTTDWRQGGVDGEVEVSMQTVYPYMNFTPANSTLNLWGMVGLGSGEAEVASDFGIERTTDIDLRMMALGLRALVVDGYDLKLFAKGDILVVSVSSEEDDILGEADASVNQLRLATEGRFSMFLTDVAQLEPIFEVGLRLDGGDEDGGAGLELGGGVAYVNSDIGLLLEMRGRRLMAHARGGIGDWSAGFLVRYKPVADCGIDFSLAPTWGKAATNSNTPWRTETPLFDTNANLPQVGHAPIGWHSRRLDLELRYRINGTNWSITPYAGLDFAGDKERLRLGIQLGTLNMKNGALRLNVFGDRLDPTAPIRHDLGLEARLHLSLH